MKSKDKIFDEVLAKKAVMSITRMIRAVRPNGALRKKSPAPTDTVAICAI